MGCCRVVDGCVRKKELEGKVSATLIRVLQGENADLSSAPEKKGLRPGILRVSGFSNPYQGFTERKCRPKFGARKKKGLTLGIVRVLGFSNPYQCFTERK